MGPPAASQPLKPSRRWATFQPHVLHELRGNSGTPARGAVENKGFVFPNSSLK